MSSSGGSAAIRDAIEARRSKIQTPGVSLKTLEKDAARKKAWWVEHIHIAYLDDLGEPVAGCVWKVPRRNLTEIQLRTLCWKCPLQIKIEYLKDQTSGDIVWPADAQMQCHSPPWSYAVVAVEEKDVIDRSRDPCYFGELRTMIFNVPLKTNDDLTEVTPEDIRAWLLCGLQEEDEEVKEAQEIVRTLEQEAKVVEHNLSRVGYMKFTEKTGFGNQEKQTLTDDEQAAKREEQNEALSAQRDKMEKDVQEARAVLNSILNHRKNTPVDLELANLQPTCGTGTYYISFPGFQGSQLEDIVCAKTDWPGIKLATKHDDLPPWAGRGDIPDGSKSYIPRYTENAVNMRGAQICRLQHGFGQHKVARVAKPKAKMQATIDSSMSAPPATSISSPKFPFVEGRKSTPPQPTVPAKTNSPLRPRRDAAPARASPSTGTPGGMGDTGGKAAKAALDDRSGGERGRKGSEKAENIAFAGKAFSFFHGEYKEGRKHGFGIEYTDAGVYYGEYEGDRRTGPGTFHCANGDHVEGNFVSETRFPEAETSHNPYKEGVPHGQVEIQFASGATYRGEVTKGRITGKGEFVSCLGERYSGDFVDGRLHGEGSKIDVVGQTWDGQWCDGEMHGSGRHSAPEIGEFEGDWVSGEWQGKGKIAFKGGNIYEGFVLNNGRSGPGTLFRGNVKRVYDPRSGRNLLRSNRVYEGSWRANELRSGSMVSLTRAGVGQCVGAGDIGVYNRAIDRIKRREHQVQRKTTESLDFYERYETLLRTQVEKKKSRLYAQQAKLANQDLISDHFKKLTVDDLKEAFSARAISTEQIMRVSGKQLDAGTGSMARAAARVEQEAEARGASSRGTLLSTLIQSRLEEAQELQQLVNIADTAASAESLAHAQQAQVNYSARP